VRLRFGATAVLLLSLTLFSSVASAQDSLLAGSWAIDLTHPQPPSENHLQFSRNARLTIDVEGKRVSVVCTPLTHVFEGDFILGEEQVVTDPIQGSTKRITLTMDHGALVHSVVEQTGRPSRPTRRTTTHRLSRDGAFLKIEREVESRQSDASPRAFPRTWAWFSNVESHAARSAPAPAAVDAVRSPSRKPDPAERATGLDSGVGGAWQPDPDRPAPWFNLRFARNDRLTITFTGDTVDLTVAKGSPEWEGTFVLGKKNVTKSPNSTRETTAVSVEMEDGVLVYSWVREIQLDQPRFAGKVVRDSKMYRFSRDGEFLKMELVLDSSSPSRPPSPPRTSTAWWKR